DSMTFTIMSPKVPAGSISCGGNSITLTATGAVPADYPNYVWYSAASGGTVLGVGSPVTLTYANTAAAPASVWVEVAASTSTSSSGSNTIGMATGSLSWAASPNTGPIAGPIPFTVLANTLTLNSFDIKSWTGASGNITVTIQNSSSVTVFQQTYTVPTNSTAYTVNINNTFPMGSYTISVASGAAFQWFGGTWAGGTNAGQISLPTYGPAGEYPLANLSYSYTNYSVTTTCSQEVQVNLSCSLPVELIDFTGQAAQQSVNLQWTTTSEINNDYYDVQRSSDGVHFQTIGMVNGGGNSKTILSYRYQDSNPTNGINYYRLLQYDFNGKSTPSNDISVSFNESGKSFTVAPNPFTESFAVALQDLSGGELTILDALGRSLYSQSIEAGTEKIQLGNQLSKGAYVLRYSNTRGVATQMIIKE
ncbi:MAG TPA: T9SS type A sorting domain-containing protein, partial [Cytophagaceae bacterium]|nr:T9SS type A sorting domain-containing protein [Cytophagaceae bacterium]